MGKKSRRQRVPNAASRRGATPVTSDMSRLKKIYEQRAATIAAIEAEFRAASHEQAASRNSALMDAVSLDEDDNANLHQYLLRQDKHPFTQEMIQVITRWPRIRKYWPRIRRRICSGCGKQYDLSEPRLLVCGECGEGRYCDKACQRAHWPEHMGPCLKAVLEGAKERRSQGEISASTERLRETYLKLYSR